MIKRLHPHFFVRTPIEIQLLPISHTKEDITSQYRQGSSGCDDLISKHKLEIKFLHCSNAIQRRCPLQQVFTQQRNCFYKTFLIIYQILSNTLATFSFLRHEQKKRTNIFFKFKIRLDFQMSAIIPSDLFYAHCDNSTQNTKSRKIFSSISSIFTILVIFNVPIIQGLPGVWDFLKVFTSVFLTAQSLEVPHAQPKRILDTQLTDNL